MGLEDFLHNFWVLFNDETDGVLNVLSNHHLTSETLFNGYLFWHAVISNKDRMADNLAVLRGDQLLLDQEEQVEKLLRAELVQNNISEVLVLGYSQFLDCLVYPTTKQC